MIEKIEKLEGVTVFKNSTGPFEWATLVTRKVDELVDTVNKLTEINSLNKEIVEIKHATKLNKKMQAELQKSITETEKVKKSITNIIGLLDEVESTLLDDTRSSIPIVPTT